MLRDMSQYGQLGVNRRENPEGFQQWINARNAAANPAPTTPAAPTAFQQSLQQPFVPEQAPGMLPMQPGMQGMFQQQQNMQGQMPATKGAGKGSMSQQMPQQATPTATTGKPFDIQGMIRSLMSSGLLGNL